MYKSLRAIQSFGLETVLSLHHESNCGQVSSGQSLLTTGSGERHCQQSLLAAACSEQSLLAIASSEKSLLPTASSKQSLLLLPTVTDVCMHARACMCTLVYMYHSAGKLSTCPLEGKFGHSLLLLPTVTTVYPCVFARACMRTEVYIYHSTGTISMCMLLHNVLTQNSIFL